MNKNKYGVHKTHCCVKHGCKYGDKDCPVVSKKIKQEYLCECCEYDGINSIEELFNEINSKKDIKKEFNKYIKEYLSENLRINSKKVNGSYGEKDYIIIQLELNEEILSECYIDD